MKKNCLLIVALLLCLNVLKAQIPVANYNNYFKEGNFLLLEENYDVALVNFLNAYNLDSSSANINFNVGYCYLNSSSKKGLAERYLAKAILNISKSYNQDNSSEKGAPPIAHFLYGKALHINYKFDEAIAQYEYYEKNFPKDKTTLAEIKSSKEQSKYAKELVAAPINVELENMGDSINGRYPDFSPILSADESMIIYTSRRNTSTGGEKTPDGQYFEDILVSYKDQNNIWSSPKSISPNINTNGHDAAISVSPDGQTLITFRDDNGNGNIYYSTWDGSDWSPIQSFGSDINSTYWETHACLSNDGNTLYFVSDRPGGYGGRDIYRCVKLPNGAWSKATNAGPVINTAGDEEGPFMHPDGVTFMFSSNGHKTMGGFDIFFSIIDEDRKFTEVINMSSPINTPDDDVFFVTSPDGKRGYFSSGKDGGFGEKDIYKMTIPDAREKPLALFKGSILAADGEKLPDELEIIVTNKETGEIVGKYKPKENGSFATILAPNKNYNFSYQSKGEEFYNEDLYVPNEIVYSEIKKEINLEPISLVGKVKARNNSILLNTFVLNNINDKQPVADAKLVLLEKGSNEVVYATDNLGKKDGIELKRDKSYTIYAEVNGKKSKTLSVNTIAVKGGKLITEALYMDEVSPIAKANKPKKGKAEKVRKEVDFTCGSAVIYKLNFGYNANDGETTSDWDVLIDAIVSKTKDCNPQVKIMSSASQVPTKLYNSNNKQLADSRADKMEEKIKSAVAAKGADVTKIKFVKVAAVRGPVYENDAQNTKKYIPFQYVKVIAR